MGKKQHQKDKLYVTRHLSLYICKLKGTILFVNKYMDMIDILFSTVVACG